MRSENPVNFDGEKVVEATDDAFAAAGGVSVGPKSDSVTLFDDCSYGTNRP